MAQSPDVSVVVPAFNDAEGLRSLIPALIDQSLAIDRYEILIVDNRSSDGTQQVLNRYAEKYPDIVTALAETQVQSSYAARNRGVERAQGEIVAFTDADCRPCEDWLERGLGAFEDPKVGLVAGRIDTTFLGDRPNLWEFIEASYYVDQQHFAEDGGYGATGNLFVRRELFKTHGTFREDLKSGGDNEFGRRVTTRGEKIVYCDDAVVRHRALRSFSDLVSREIRVGTGIGRLYDMGILDWNPRDPGCFLPRLHLPRSVAPEITLPKRWLALLFYNILRYINLFYRF